MFTAQTQRKLAVILHADIESSTSLVQQDETVAHQRITDAFKRFSETTRSYGGTVHEIRGDALVAEFARASDAVCAAVAFQQSHAQHLRTFTDGIAPHLRIGIGLGEVVFADNTVTGEGVVLAQRVEQLSARDGVCITGAIHEAIPKRLSLKQKDLGERELKGFDEPVRIYALHLDEGAELPKPTAEAAGRDTRTTRRIVGLAAIVLVVVAGGGLLAWLQPWAPESETAPAGHVAFPLPDKPSIAVLPFTNMNEDSDQEYFADGITEDIITELARHRELFVIARNSTFAYKGTSINVQDVGRELGVRYVLEGSVRRTDEKIRFTAQLIDARNNTHLWAERYDKDLEDIFAVQDELSRTVAALLIPHVRQAEESTSLRKPTQNLKAYDLLMRGRYYKHKLTKEGMNSARQIFERVIETDPTLAEAYAYLAFNNAVAFALRYSREPGTLEQALELIQQALALAPDLPIAYQAMSQTLAFMGRFDEASIAGYRAIELNPNDAENHIIYSRAASTAGYYKEALEAAESAMRLNPLAPIWYFFIYGRALYADGQYKEAAEVLQSGINRSPSYTPTRVHLIAALAHLNRQEEARQNVDALLEAIPEYTIVSAQKGFGFKDSEMDHRFLDDLRRAGIPEG